MSEIVFQQQERMWIAVGVVAVGLLLLWIGYRKSPLTGARKWAAMLCKFLAIVLLALLLLDPQWVREIPRKGANEVVLAVDNGASMSVAEKGAQSRGELVRAALGGDAMTASWIGEIGKLFRVRATVFDDRLRSVKDLSSLKFDGAQSALCMTAKSLADRGTSGVTAAVVVFTDGNATDAETWKVAKEKCAPVFPVVAGKKNVERDLTLAEVSSVQSAFEESPVTVSAKVRASGFKGEEIALSVLGEDGKELAVEKHRFADATGEHLFRMQISGVKTGLSFFRVVVKRADETKGAGEAVMQNNERVIAVDSGSGPYRVLYVGGRPNWEYKFLRRALAGDADVQMPSLVRIAKREPKFEWRGKAGESSNPLFRGFGAKDGAEAQRYDQPVWTRLSMKDAKELTDGFPKAAEQLFGEYRAIILDDIEAEAFTGEQMNLLERFVSQRGGALVMLGGQESFQAGGWEHTAVGRMLPVYLDRVTQAPPLDGARFNITREGWLEPWIRLRVKQEDDETRLAAMPAFFAVNQVFSIKPGASVLATISGDEQKAYPAIATQRFGEGRVAAVTVGDVWRWGMMDKERHADMDKAWRQLMRWLVVDVPDRVTLDDERVKEGGQSVVKLRTRVRDEAFRAMDDAVVKFVVQRPGGEKVDVFAEPSLKEAGVFEAEFFPRESGAYRVKTDVKDGKGASMIEARGGWAHSPLVEEYASLDVNRALLERMAAETGGKMLELDEVSKLPELLAGLNVPVKQVLADPLWHSPWVFLAVLGLLAAEWVLRRRGGWV